MTFEVIHDVAKGHCDSPCHACILASGILRDLKLTLQTNLEMPVSSYMRFFRNTRADVSYMVQLATNVICLIRNATACFAMKRSCYVSSHDRVN